jgi:hypothetical protein
MHPTDFASELQIAIPSHSRARQLQERTLQVLYELGLLGRTTVFVAPEDMAEYSAMLPGIRLATGALGLVQNRDAIHGAFPLGTPVLSLDDDLRAVKGIDGRGALSPLNREEFLQLVYRGFALLNTYHGALWGVNPTGDPLFLRGSKTYSVGAMPIEACMYGFISGYADLSVPVLNLPGNGSFDDMERCSRVWTAGWNLVRFNRVTYVASKSAAGGKGAGLRENLCDEVHRIVELYPRIAVHTFGKLPNQSKCRVSIRPRSAIAMPRSKSDVYAVRDRIMAAPLPPLPPLHDVSYIPDTEARQRETEKALAGLTVAVWGFLSGDIMPQFQCVDDAALKYITPGDEAAALAAAREIRLAASKAGPRSSATVSAAYDAARAVHKAQRLMMWDIRERPEQVF